MRRLSKIEYPVRLDIGCGQNKLDGFVGMDCRDYGQEILWDINDGIPLPDNSVIEVASSHFVEHLKEHEIENFIWELVRVCQKGAKINISCPHKDCPEAYYICHHSLWDENRIEGICKELSNFGLKLLNVSRDGINLIMNLIIQ